MNVGVDKLVGKRVELVAMRPEHAEGLFEIAGPPEIWPYMPVHPPRTLDDMRKIVASAIAAREQGTEWPFVIFDRETGKAVGSTRYLDITPAHNALEIGWTWHSPSVWRTRVNTECKYLLLGHAFETVGVIRVTLKTDGRNLRSQEAIARIGAIKEGVLRKHRILPDGYVRDSVYFSVLREEWPAVKQKLEDMLA